MLLFLLRRSAGDVHETKQIQVAYCSKDGFKTISESNKFPRLLIKVAVPFKKTRSADDSITIRINRQGTVTAIPLKPA